MIEGLLVAILVFECIRLWLYIQDSVRTKRINKQIEVQQQRALEFADKQDKDWKKIRELEIKELKQLAKESDTMKEIYDEWKAQNLK